MPRPWKRAALGWDWSYTPWACTRRRLAWSKQHPPGCAPTHWWRLVGIGRHWWQRLPYPTHPSSSAFSFWHSPIASTVLRETALIHPATSSWRCTSSTTIFLRAGAVAFLQDGWLVVSRRPPLPGWTLPTMSACLRADVAVVGRSLAHLNCEAGGGQLENTVSVETHVSKAAWNPEPRLDWIIIDEELQISKHSFHHRVAVWLRWFDLHTPPVFSALSWCLRRW